MDAEIGHSLELYRMLNWLEANWRRAAVIATGIIVIGVVVAYVIWQGQEKEKKAAQALSSLLVSGDSVSADALLQLAGKETGTQAAARATLMAAGRLFADGEYQEAQAQFENFLQAGSFPSLIAEARLGIAACQEARDDTAGAIAGYKAIVDDPASGNVLPQARFALGGLYAKQGEVDLARTQYELLASDRSSSLSSEAMSRLGELPPKKSEVTPGVEAVTTVSTNQN